MKLTRMFVVAAVLALIPAAVSFADSIKADGFTYSDDLTVNGVTDGKLDTQIKGTQKFFDLSTVEWIELAGQPNFNKAEQSRKDAKASAELYKKALQNINDRKLKLLAQLRAIGPTDADGKFTEAMGYFLDVYAVSPTDAIWKFRPTHIPAAPSKMLGAAADLIKGKVSSFKSEEAKKNLKTLELDLLTKAGDKTAAAALAKELGTGEVEPAPTASGNAATPGPAEPAVSPGEGLQGVSNAVQAKAYDKAITQADSLLKNATGDTAVRLFELKAQALVGLKKMDEASAEYLRVLAHYPGSPNVIPDIQKAADIQKALGHTDEAKRLTEEITAIRNRPRN